MESRWSNLGRKELFLEKLLKLLNEFFSGDRGRGGLRLGLWSCDLRVRVNGRGSYKKEE